MLRLMRVKQRESLVVIHTMSGGRFLRGRFPWVRGSVVLVSEHKANDHWML